MLNLVPYSGPNSALAEPRQRVAITLLALLGLLLVSLPGNAGAVEPEPEPPFCERHVLHDYLAPLKRMPKLREPPFRATGRDIHFRGLEIASSGPTLAVSGGRVGYQLNWERNPGFDLTITLAEVDWRGRFMRRIAQRQVHLDEFGAASITEPNIGLKGAPAVYRTTLVVRSPSGRKLAQFGNYYRVIRPTVHARFALSSDIYQPGTTMFARLENPGAAFVLFGEDYAIEKLEGESWVRSPESPGPFSMPLYFVAPGTTSGHCTAFPIPPTMPAGRYRLAQEAIFGWPRQSRAHEPRPTLHAEFDVVP